MIVMITGASRGIGFETAKYFARLQGVEIYALSRNIPGLKQLVSECLVLNNSSPVHSLEIDLDRIIEDPVALHKLLPPALSHVDILINNAGMLVNKPFLETGPDEAENLFRINFLVPAILIRQLMPWMGQKGSTHVVNISSMGGFQGSMKFSGLAYYSASKAALACLTECLSEEFKDSAVAFNCLALGSVQTEMLEEAFPGYKAPLRSDEIAEFIGNFALNGHKYMRGKIVPVSLTTP